MTPMASRITRLRSPLGVFLIVGLGAGLGVTLLTPRFAGIDEPYHYLRSWSLTDGQLVTERGPLPGDVTAGGLCLPTPLVRELYEERVPYLRRQLPNWDGTDVLKTTTCPDGRVDHRFVDVATFAWYSPIGYAPQAVGVGIGRIVGAGVGAQSMLARLASLAVYLAMVGLAVAVTPRGKWAMVAVALLPASLFQAVTSLSPDGMTIAAVLLVCATALRAADDRPDRLLSSRRVALEALAGCTLLGLTKPTYLVVAVIYLMAAARRRWIVIAPVAIAAAISAAWYASQRPKFVCDVRYFLIPTDPDAQTSNLLHRPWELITATGRGVVHFGGEWTTDVISISTDRIVSWGLVVCSLALLAFVALGTAVESGATVEDDSARDEMALRRWDRVILVGAGVATLLAMFAGWLISCSRPELELLNPPAVRLLVPALPPILIGCSWWKAPRWFTATAGAVLGAFFVAWLITLAVTMR